MAVSFKWNAAEINKRLAELEPTMQSRIRSRVRRAAERAEVEMKIKAPWTETGLENRWGRVSTGEARAGLYAKASQSTVGGNTLHSIVMGNTSDHGIWLEIAMSGRFQIIMPTVKATGEALMKSFTELMGDSVGLGEVAEISPELGTRGTSQGVEVRAGRAAYRTRSLATFNRGNVLRGVRRHGGVYGDRI